MVNILIEVMSVLEPLEHSVPDVALVWGVCSLIKMTMSDPLEHSGLGVTVHVDMYYRLERWGVDSPS